MTQHAMSVNAKRMEVKLRLTKKRVMADGPVSRILCRTQTAKRPAHAAIIPLVPVSLPGSGSLPEGFIEPGRLSPPIWPCTTRGFPCPRCHHRGGGLLPHLFTLAKRREHFEDVSQVSLCDATALHSAGGLFSVALSVTPLVGQAFLPVLPDSPPGVTRRVALSRVPLTIPQPPFGVRALTNVPQDGVRTFLPPSHLAMTKPAITRPARQFNYTLFIAELS